MNGTKLKKFYGCFYGQEVDDSGSPLPGAEIFTLGEVAELALSFSGEPIQYKGRSCITNGVTLATRAGNDDTVDGKLRIDDWVPEVLAAGFRATSQPQNITASSVSTTITFVGVDKYVEIGTKRLDNVVVTLAGDTLIEGEDYTINAYLGIIAPLIGGKLTTGTETVDITADGLADSSTQLSIGAGTLRKFRIIGSVINEWNNKKGDLELYKVSLSTDGDILLHDRGDDEVAPLSFKATPEGIVGKDGIGTFSGEALM